MKTAKSVKIISKMNIRLNVVTIMLIASIMCSCKSQKEKITENINVGVKKFLENTAFKNNQKIEIFELNILNYKDIGQFELDSIRRILVFNHINGLLDKVQKSNNQAKEYGRQGNLYRSLGMESTQYFEDALAEGIKGRKLLDSVDIYTTTAKTLSSTPRDGGKTHYMATCFLKATTPNGNILDTIKYVLDKDFNVINLKLQANY